ncbi:MAG: hypothetical protein K2P68_10835 [Sphingomonas sp.]|nr:hypothetical protein [Sphingomonas sp.]
MGDIKFLVGQNAPASSYLPKAIDDLEDASHTFVRRWAQGSLPRAQELSDEAMVLLDFIANELLRRQVERKGLSNFTGSAFETALSEACGRGAKATIADQKAMVEVGPGTGLIAASLEGPSTFNLGQMLNKIKHRNPSLTNFRIDEGRHIFVVCTEHTAGGAEGIYEFDVVKFCQACKNAASEP